VNVLRALPKKEQPEAGERLTAMLTRDWERLVAFFEHPQQSWIHLRTTNIVGAFFKGGAPQQRRCAPLQEGRERRRDVLEAASWSPRNPSARSTHRV
jgi:transposase-like protein